MYILKGLRPMSPTRTLHTSRPPDRHWVTMGVPETNQVINSLVRHTLSRQLRFLAGPWAVSSGALRAPMGDPRGRMGSPWGLRGESRRIHWGSLGVSVGGPGWASKNFNLQSA